MGFEMYLYAKKIIYPANQIDMMENLSKLLPELKNVKLTVKYISFEMGYWDRAYSVHNWFLKNVQNNEDSEKVYEVSIDQLTDLKIICERILKEKNNETNDIL